ncbi:hypothetical protein N200_01270 [Helicobacter pylori UM065]|nr:hypothetical protein N200_01270 [Helicobacter pylori UM065]
MLDKVTKTCYNPTRPFLFYAPFYVLFLVKLLKGFYQSHS